MSKSNVIMSLLFLLVAIFIILANLEGLTITHENSALMENFCSRNGFEEGSFTRRPIEGYCSKIENDLIIKKNFLCLDDETEKFWRKLTKCGFIKGAN